MPTTMPTETPDDAPAKPLSKAHKDLEGVEAVTPYLPFETLHAQLIANAPAQPVDKGTVSLLVERPATNARKLVKSAALTVAGGMARSGWTLDAARGRTDQICVMSTASIRAITNGDAHDVWAAAGDQLFFDFDLSRRNLAVGDRVVLGDAASDASVVLQVTSKPHNGCAKFDRRFGPGALKVVSVPDGKQRRLRGVYFHVVRPGVVKEGDCITKVASDFGDA